MAGIGTGRSDTATVVAADDGAYITASSNGYPTVWYKLQQTRDAFTGGNNDWFIPSKSEIEELRLAVKSGSITGGTIAGSSYAGSVFKKGYVWSSSESHSYSYYWSGSNQDWFTGDKENRNSVLFARTF